MLGYVTSDLQRCLQVSQSLRCCCAPSVTLAPMIRQMRLETSPEFVITEGQCEMQLPPDCGRARLRCSPWTAEKPLPRNLRWASVGQCNHHNWADNTPMRITHRRAGPPAQRDGLGLVLPKLHTLSCLSHSTPSAPPTRSVGAGWARRPLCTGCSWPPCNKCRSTV